MLGEPKNPAADAPHRREHTRGMKQSSVADRHRRRRFIHKFPVQPHERHDAIVAWASRPCLCYAGVLSTAAGTHSTSAAPHTSEIATTISPAVKCPVAVFAHPI